MKSRSLFLTFFILILSLAFSSWLMISTFSYGKNTDTMKIASKVWSDFGAHIPMIRSFSFGDNLTRLLHGKMPEYPLFPGEPIRYHFLFYMGVGILEKLGIRIDWALNSLSIIGFSAMLLAIYSVAKTLFDDWRVGILTWLFTIFNGSLTFLKYFREYPFSPDSLIQLWDFDRFLSFAPWGDGDISAFWSLNIYTNQRHLAFAFAIFFLFLLTLIQFENSKFQIPACADRQNPKSKIQNLILIPWGIICGFLPFFYQPTFVAIGIACLWFLLAVPKLRIPLIVMGLITAIIALPQLIVLSKNQGYFAVSIGYIIDKPFTIASVITYWWHNIGGHMILIPLGYVLAPKKAKKYLSPLFLFFITGFCFQFSRELSANHKFFNLFLIMGSMFSAYVIIRIITWIQSIQQSVLRFPLYIIPMTIILFLTLSGVVDLMPIKNDRILDLPDIKANKNAEWFLKNTPPDAVVLNASFFLHPASLAGRKIFLGWPYFPWSIGYDTGTRLEVDVHKLYNPETLESLCQIAQSNNISFVTFENSHMEESDFNETLFQKSLPHVYSSTDGSFRVYDIRIPCSIMN